MNLNRIIFPAPRASYNRNTFDDELIWIPKNNHTTTQTSKTKFRSKSQEKTSKETNQTTKQLLCKKIILQNKQTIETEVREEPTYVNIYQNESETTERDRFEIKDRDFYKLLPYLRQPNEYTALDEHPQRSVKKNRCRSERQGRRRKYAESSESRSSSREAASATLKNSKKKGIGNFSLFGFMKKKNRKDLGDFPSAKNKSNAKSFVKLDEISEGKSAKAIDEKDSIPCLMLKNRVPTKKILIYFHANSEDLFLCYDLLDHLKKTLKVNVIAPEYPGYGIYKGKPAEAKLIADADLLYQYVITELKYKEEDVILLGRSIGSGPALHLAAKRKPGALVLMSSFTSVRAVARDRVGVLGQYLIKDRFKNIKCISEVESPTLLIHGRKDRTIPSKHSLKLYDACKTTKKIEIRPEMCHNQFDFHDDMSTPISEFLNQVTNWHLKETEQKNNTLISCIKTQQMRYN